MRRREMKLLLEERFERIALLETRIDTMDQLVERTGLTTAALSPILLAMELQGRVSVEHGRWCRRSSASFLSDAPAGASQGT